MKLEKKKFIGMLFFSAFLVLERKLAEKNEAVQINMK